MPYCLSTEDICQLIRLYSHSYPCDIDIRFEEAANWEHELQAHTYLMCRVLEGSDSNNDERQRMLNLFYELPANIYFSIQELDHMFVRYMLQHVRRHTTFTLEEELVDLLVGLSEYRYDSALRY